VYLLAHSVVSLTDISDISKIPSRNANIVLLGILLLIGIIAVVLQICGHLTAYILKGTGLQRVIRDSEIEIYYLSLIKEKRKIKCLKCGQEIPKSSKFCNNCGSEIE